MPQVRVYNLGALNLAVNPLLHKKGDMIRCLNTETDTFGAKKKRPGYATYLGTANGSQVNTLFNFTKDNGTQLWNYRASGAKLYYSTQGTGAWTVCGNGTITAESHVGHAVLNDQLIVGYTGGTPRYTSNGTSFTTIDAAAKEEHFAEYQNRIWAAGTSSNLHYSTKGTVSDWTTDSDFTPIPGPGKISNLFKSNDRLVITKNSGLMFRYDGYNLVDMATDLGPSSPYSVAEIEDYRLYLNRLGHFGYGGGKPEIVSNAVEKQVYNDDGGGIVGTVFDNAPGVAHRYDYLCVVGDVTDDLTDETVADCIHKYDFQADEWSDWKFAHKPTAWLSYRDTSGSQQLIFGDSGGQCYTQGQELDDNGEPIEVVMEGVLHGGAPERDKKHNYFYVSANPGCQAKVQVALADTFTKGKKKWIDLGQLQDGFLEARFPSGSRSRLLFWKIYESSKTTRFHFYGFTWDFDFIERR